MRIRHYRKYNESYLRGVNSTETHYIKECAIIRNGLKTILDQQQYPDNRILDMVESLGKLERYHAPKDSFKQMSNSQAWLGLAANKSSTNYQWIFTSEFASKLRIKLGKRAFMIVEPQSVSTATDLERIHILWDSNMCEGYYHSVTGQHVTKDEFEDCYEPHANFLMALSLGAGTKLISEHEDNVGDFLIQQNCTKVNEEILYYDEDSNEWHTILCFDTDEVTHYIAINTRHWKDALSIMNKEDCLLTITSQESYSNGEDFYIQGVIRLDDKCEKPKHTAIIKCGTISPEKVATTLGNKPDYFE